MRIQATKIYTFDELSEEAKQTVIENYRQDANNDDFTFEADNVKEDAKAIAALMGIEIDKIYYSGFWSQGDGACFVGDYAYKRGALQAVKEYAPLDTELHVIAAALLAVQKKHFFGVKVHITHNFRHYHNKSCDFHAWRNINGAESLDYDIELTDAIKEPLQDFMQWIYKQLEKGYEWTQSDEYILAHFVDNDYEFKEDGEII